MTSEHKLIKLLSTDTLVRSSQDYEAFYDDFIEFAGGSRITSIYSFPEGIANADYCFSFDNIEILMELKQVVKYEKYNTVNDYFLKELSRGKIRKLSKVSNNQIQITPDSLPKSEWDSFYKCFRPSISSSLNKAAKQLKDTEKFINPPKVPRIKGVILMNSGDYNLPIDLLYKLAEWKLKKEWKMGKYTSIDFVICITVDMYKEGQSPLKARNIVRTLDDKNVVNAVSHIYDKWVHYIAEALGMEVMIEQRNEDISSELDITTPFQGKIKLCAD